MPNRVALVTTDRALLGDEERDIDTLSAALRRAGFEVETPVWHDPDVAWGGFDLAVMRSPWDYPGRYREFMTWLERASSQVRVLNAPELIRWNIDKRYLVDLAAAGVRCAPFEFCDTMAEVRAAIARFAPSTLIVKPSVSVGSANTGWFAATDPKALELAELILSLGKTAMVQPAVEHVTRHGENALLFFNGEYAASFHKAPILEFGGGYLGGAYTENITRGDPTPAEISLGEQAVAAVGAIARAKGFAADAGLPLYARVDIALADGVEPQLIELEAFEPSYFSDIVPEVVDPFVRALSARLAGTVADD